MSEQLSKKPETKQTTPTPVSIIMVSGIVVSLLGVFFKESHLFEIFVGSGISMVVLSSTVILYSYIKGVNKSNETTDYISNNLKKIINDIDSIKNNRNLTDEIKDIKQILLKVNETRFGLNEEEKIQLFAKIHESIDKNISSSLLEEIESRYSSDMIKSSGLKSVKQKSTETIIRLNDELNKLNRRASLGSGLEMPQN